MLWGLARFGLIPGGGASKHPAVLRLAKAIVAEFVRRGPDHDFTAQCLSNSLWAIAKLDLRGSNFDAFVVEAVTAISKDCMGLPIY